MSEDYAGFVTRAIAFAIDVALIDLAAVIVAIVVGLGISAFEVPDVVVTIAVAVGARSTSRGSWATSSCSGPPLGRRRAPASWASAWYARPPVGKCTWRAAIVRLAGMALAAIPFFAGFLLILVDDRRRGLHDRLARTVVVYAAVRSVS